MWFMESKFLGIFTNTRVNIFMVTELKGLKSDPCLMFFGGDFVSWI